MRKKFRVCHLRIAGTSLPYQFLDRQAAARVIRDARSDGDNYKRVKTPGTLPGQPDAVRIYLAKNGVHTIIELSSY